MFSKLQTGLDASTKSLSGSFKAAASIWPQKPFVRERHRTPHKRFSKMIFLGERASCRAPCCSHVLLPNLDPFSEGMVPNPPNALNLGPWRRITLRPETLTHRSFLQIRSRENLPMPTPICNYFELVAVPIPIPTPYEFF